MLEVKYFKDYRHNYLIMKDNGCLMENRYQRKMVTENKIKGLLDSQERYINGEILLYYDITSKQSLRSICEGKCVNGKQLRKIFMQLKEVNDTLQKYLLDGSGLMLLPEYIFQNMETEEYFFIYYPDPEEGTLSQFIDFLVEKVDHEDMEAVETIYQIADLVYREQFVIDEILKWFQQEPERGEKEEAYPEREHYEEVYQAEEETEKKRGFFSLLCRWLRIIKKDAELEKKEGYLYTQTYEEGMPEVARPDFDAGSTVFVPWTENCENKLYSLDRKHKCHIDLQKLPLTVGKLAGAVDLVISETSLSRRHAKFSKEEGHVYITDLNSTNGTFRNGMRLAPNASEIIEPGDEIRLGKLKFIYR